MSRLTPSFTRSMNNSRKSPPLSLSLNLKLLLTSISPFPRYSLKEERCILCKNFKMGADSRDVHVQCARRADLPLGGPSKMLPLKIHSAVKLKTTKNSFSRSARKKAVSCPPSISVTLPPLLRNSPVDFLQPILKTNLLLGSMKSIMNPVYV